MNTENLRTFLLLCKVKNFTQTAAQLFVAQSTVTNRICELEREIGAPLFVRNKRNASLTEAGRRFFEYARRIAELEDACKKAVADGKGKSRLRVGATNAIYESAIKEKLLSRLAAGEEYQIVLGHSADLLRMLGDGVLDAAYVYQPWRKSGYDCSPFFRDELVLLIRSDKNEYPSGIRRSRLAEIPCAMCNFALQDVGAYLRELFPAGRSFSLEIDNSSKVVDYLTAGLGYSFLPRGLVRDRLERGELSEVKPLDFSPLVIDSYRVCRKGEEELFF